MKKVKLLSSLVCVLVAFNSMMAQQLDVFINDDTQPTNYRNAPNGKIVGQLKNGDMITVGRPTNGWFHIIGVEYCDGDGTYTYRYKGEKWIHSSVIGVQWINDGLLDYRLRTTPSKKGKVIYKGSSHHYVSGGEIKNVLDIKANWVKVRLCNGKVGWVERHLVWGNSLTVCL